MCNTEQLVSYVYEELSASERVEFERHLSDCAGCRQELAELRAWFLEHGQDEWDRQIARDSEAGKLDKLIAQAKRDYAAGNGREL